MPDYGPPQDDFALLAEAPKIITQWLGDDPAAAVRTYIAGLLEQRRPGTVLEWVKVTSKPTPLADGHHSHEDPEMVVITRAAVYIPFTTCLRYPDGEQEILQAALTFVAGNINQPDNRVQRTWLDVDDRGINDRLEVPDGPQFKERMMSVGQWLPSDYPPGAPERGAA